MYPSFTVAKLSNLVCLIKYSSKCAKGLGHLRGLGKVWGRLEDLYCHPRPFSYYKYITDHSDEYENLSIIPDKFRRSTYK